MEFIMYSVNIYILGLMDHDPKWFSTQKLITIFLIKDHWSMDHDQKGSLYAKTGHGSNGKGSGPKNLSRSFY